MSPRLADGIKLTEEAEGHLDAIGGKTADRLVGWLDSLPLLPADACPPLTWWPEAPPPRHARFGAHVAIVRVRGREGRRIAVIVGVIHEDDLAGMREQCFAEVKAKEGE